MSAGANTSPRADAGPGPDRAGVSPDKRRVVVVGPCASGKSTLVAGLRRLGYRAMVCGQEHSEIQTLWQHAGPDLLVALDVDLPTLRRRRGEEWPEWLYLVQQTRLRGAKAAADLRLDTSKLDAAAVLDRVTSRLRWRAPRAG